jgi:hypothetical protein
MKIIWNENPLRTVVMLDDKDKEILLLKLKIDYLEEAVFSAHDDLEKGNIDAAKKTLDPSLFEGEDAYAFPCKLLGWYIDELGESHAGDCTCFPASCPKCCAENTLGIDTTKGLGKRAGSRVYALFSKEGMTLDKAIEELDNYAPVKGVGWERMSQADFDSSVPRWLDEAKRAAEWLRAYRAEHFISADQIAEIVQYFEDNKESEIFPSDIADLLDVDWEIANEACSRLAALGKIKRTTV